MRAMIDLPKEQFDVLDEIARRKGLSRDDVILMAVNKYLEAERSAGLADKSQG